MNNKRVLFNLRENNIYETYSSVEYDRSGVIDIKYINVKRESRWKYKFMNGVYKMKLFFVDKIFFFKRT
jgi:hypothetical protein